MTLLIDGYNLLHAAGLLGRRLGPGGLARARGALLALLAASLTPEEASQTIVVFDAGEAAPRDRPRSERLHSVQVQYAPFGEEADDVLERLIASDSAPKQLTVVSGDHRLQRAARRRKAKAINGEDWLSDLNRRRQHSANQPPSPISTKPTGPLSAEEVERWLTEFGFE